MRPANNTIEIVPHVDCTGCGACMNKCSVDAISMEIKGGYFAYPCIDESKCVHCGLCAQACPVLHPDFSNNLDPQCYAYWADDKTREVSTSGGAFSCLANEIIDRGGLVIGAAYSEDCYSVVYQTASDRDELPALRGSKYAQAQVGFVFRSAKQSLKDGKPVLFVGCPCQVAGIKAFLGRDEPLLYCADLVCHGAPSPVLFKRFVQELEAAEGSKAIEVRFRDKSFVPWNHCTSIRFSNGSEYRKKKGECVYLRAFLDRLDMRESCGHCKFAAIPRQGDITLADFWDIDRFNKKYDDRKGTSLLLVNNEKGKELLDILHKNAKLLEPAPLEHAIKYNSQIKFSSMHNEKRQRFYSLMEDYNYSFSKAADYALRDRFDVGFVGWWYGANYGSALTAFALNRALISMGKSVLMLNWPMNPPTPPGKGSRGRVFGEKFYDISPYLPLAETGEFNKHCDCFVVGSDQLWNWYSNRDTGSYYFFLDWVDDHHKKIAYSTSFGHDSVYYPYNMRLRLCYLLSRFDSISVREHSGIEVCKHDFGVEAVQTMDPVFLASEQDYERALSLSSLAVDEPYVIAYIMNPTPDKRDAVKKVAKELNLPYKIIVDGQEDYQELKALLDDDENLLENMPVEDWLFLIKHASYVVTDSFHGFCFSLIFKRQVSVFPNLLRGKARFDTLSVIAGVENRLFQTYEDFVAAENWLHEIDYDQVESRMAPEIEASREWLLNALEARKKQPSAREIGTRTLLEINKRLASLEQAKDAKQKGSLHGAYSRVADITKRGVRCIRTKGMRYAFGRFKEKVANRLHR